MSLNLEFRFLSPVQSIKVTSQNLEEVAEWCGGIVGETESRRKAGEMDRYVAVPVPEGPKISHAFPGMFITQRVVAVNKRVGNKFVSELKTSWAVFRRDYFDSNYFETPNEAVEVTWGKKPEKGKGNPKAEQERSRRGDKKRAQFDGDISKYGINQKSEDLTDKLQEASERIDLMHGPGASDALDAAIKDGSIFSGHGPSIGRDAAL